jgi:hypothetical protein
MGIDLADVVIEFLRGELMGENAGGNDTAKQSGANRRMRLQRLTSFNG